MKKEAMKLPPPVNCRLEGWARYRDTVAVIIVKNGIVRVIWGHISSHPTNGDKIADNTTRTAVWGNQAFNECADGADDAYERDFMINDPNLLKEPEAQLLRNEKVALEWFKGVYLPEIIKKIAKALSNDVPPKCPDCGFETKSRGPIFKCLNCGKEVGTH